MKIDALEDWSRSHDCGSLRLEDIEQEAWPEQVYRPEILEKEETLIKKPGYNPFDY